MSHRRGPVSNSLILFVYIVLTWCTSSDTKDTWPWWYSSIGYHGSSTFSFTTFLLSFPVSHPVASYSSVIVLMQLILSCPCSLTSYPIFSLCLSHYFFGLMLPPSLFTLHALMSPLISPSFHVHHLSLAPSFNSFLMILCFSLFLHHAASAPQADRKQAIKGSFLN